MAKMTIKAFKDKQHIAAFVNELYARRFSISFTLFYGGTIELVHPSGMIGQYTKGETSPEFKLHHDTCFDGPPK